LFIIIGPKTCIQDLGFDNSFFFPFNVSMLKTLDRYQKCSYGAVEVNKPAKELEV
jgi:hypothetical protein